MLGHVEGDWQCEKQPTQTQLPAYALWRQSVFSYSHSRIMGTTHVKAEAAKLHQACQAMVLASGLSSQSCHIVKQGSEG